jgi:hypothetical protein
MMHTAIVMDTNSWAKECALILRLYRGLDECCSHTYVWRDHCMYESLKSELMLKSITCTTDAIDRFVWSFWKRESQMEC